MSKIKKTLYAVVALISFLACSKNLDKLPDETIIMGLASPIQISNSDTTLLILQDYFMKPEWIDSLTPMPGFKLNLNKTEKTLLLIPESLNASISGNLRFWVKGNSFDIPLKHRYRKTIHFAIKNNPDLDSVQLAGDFNSWNPRNTMLKLEGDSFRCDLNLAPGQYGYQIVKNGIWELDANQPEKMSNGQGGFNSVINVNELEFGQIPKIGTASFAKNTITINLFCNLKSKVNAYLGNHLLKISKRDTMGVNESITFAIPDFEQKVKRSHVRVFCQNHLSSGNDILIPLDNGKPITNSKLLGRSDYESNILYFMMIDRFSNGNKANDYKMDTNLVKPKAQYYGGDLQGILNQLKSGYFEKLGVNAIWLSPITQNPSGAWGQFKDPDTKFSGYHGYWPTTLTTVDSRFGDEKILKALLDEAHNRNINVFLDYVAHHLHIEHNIIKKNPNWVTPLYLPNGSMNTERWDDYRLTTWFDTFMPTLNLTDQKITDYMVDSALHWVRDFSFDGFRHDATKHIPLNFWRTLTKKIKTEVEIPQKKHIYQIGETYGNNELISSYVGTGMLDAQFDFNLYDAMLPVFTNDKESFIRLNKALNQSFSYYGSHHLMGNITGNQDKPRFISYADGQITSTMSTQETKRIGWKQAIQVIDTNAYKKLAAAHAFNLTIPGIPIIYYGDEFGMPGANDPDNRRMMKFTDLSKNENWLIKTNTQLTEIRKNSMAMLYGDFNLLMVTDKMYAYSRNYFGETIWVIFNKDSKESKFVHERNFGKETVLMGRNPETNTKNYTLKIAPYSFSIIRFEN